MRKLKLFAILTMLTFVLTNGAACSNDDEASKEKIWNSQKNEAAKENAEPQERLTTQQVTEDKENLTMRQSDEELTANTEKSQEPKVLNVESVGKAEKGKAVNFTWKDNGKTYSFAEYTKGKVVLLNFWATWCAPCRMEIPSFVEINKELPDDEFTIIGVALDRKGSVEQIRKLIKDFAKKQNVNYLNFLPTKDIISPYGEISAIPTTFIIDKKGNIVEKIRGAKHKSHFLKSIKKAMK